MIGFIVPMEKEARTLVGAIEKRKHTTLKARKLVAGSLAGKKCAVLITGTGKIRSASGTQLLLDHFKCKVIYHFGSAGALSPDFKIGDFVVATDILEHDYIRKFGEEEENPVAHCQKQLGQRILKAAVKLGVRAQPGRIVSGNEDVVTTSRRDELCQRFGGVSVDWESAGCALVCNTNRVPVVVIRAISDYAYEHTHDEYSQNAIDVCAKVCEFLIQFLSSSTR